MPSHLPPEELQRMLALQAGLRGELTSPAETEKFDAVARPNEEVLAVADLVQEKVRALQAALYGALASNLALFIAYQSSLSSYSTRLGRDRTDAVWVYHVLMGSGMPKDRVDGVSLTHFDFPSPRRLLGEGGQVETFVKAHRVEIGEDVADQLLELHAACMQALQSRPSEPLSLPSSESTGFAVTL